MNRNIAVQKYFTKTPHESEYINTPKISVMFVTCLIIGISLLGFGFAILQSTGSMFSSFWSFVNTILGWIIILGGVFSLFMVLVDRWSYWEEKASYKKAYDEAEPKPSDSEIDQWRERDISNIIGRAYQRLGLDPEDNTAKPLILGGPADHEDTKFAIGRDGRVRYTHINILVVFLTEYKIATYQCIHSLQYEGILNDGTKEFPYKEITNLETKMFTKSITFINDQSVSNGVEQFALYTTGANVIDVTYSFSQSKLVTVGSAEYTIKAIRRKLEEYKMKYTR